MHSIFCEKVENHDELIDSEYRSNIRKSHMRSVLPVKALRLSTAIGAALLAAPQVVAADTVTVDDPAEFESALSQIAANGSGTNSIIYNGPSGDLVINSTVGLPGRNSNLSVTINPAKLVIGNTSEGQLTVGLNSSIDMLAGGGKQIVIGQGNTGTLVIDAATVNVSGIGSNTVYVGGDGKGGTGHLIIRNGGVLNMGTDAATTYTGFFGGYYGQSEITLDNGRINFGEQGASIRIGLGGNMILNLANGSVIDSSLAASHFRIGEFTGGTATVNVDNSTIIIMGGGTNAAIDDRYFIVGEAGGTGVVNQSGDNSHVHIAGLALMGIGRGNGSSGTYNLNGGLFEIGTPTLPGVFYVGLGYQASQSTAVFNVNGGTALFHGNLEIANAGTVGFRPDATVNINDGVVTVKGKVRFGPGDGKMNLNGGALELGGTDAILGTGVLTFEGGAIRATSDLTINHAATVEGVGGRLDSNGHLFTYSGVISGEGGVIKEGAGTLLLNAASTYTGGTTVRGGILETAHANALGAAGGRVTLDGGALKLSTLVDLSGGITAGTGNGVLDMAGHNVTLGGASSGPGGVTFNNGNLTLAGTLGWSGQTVLGENVTLTTTAANQLSSSSTLNLASTATLQNGNYAQQLGGLAGAGAVNSNGVLSIGSNNASTTFSGVISGAAELHKVGTGTLTLTNEQAYTGGTVVEAGTLKLAGNGAFVDGSDFRIVGGVLDLGGKTQEAGRVSIVGGTVVNGVLNAAGVDLESGHSDSEIVGSADLVKTGTGTVTLGGVNSNFSGTVIVEEGELRGAIGAFGTSGAIENDGLVTFVEDGSAVWDGAITGSGDLALTGGGDFEILGDDNTYSGQTLIDEGSLRVNGSIANSTVVVGAGGTLGGNGTVGGVIASGVVAPGNSIGTITVVGDVTFVPGSVYQVEVNAAGDSDLIAATGAAVLTGGEVQVLPEAGEYDRRTNYTILTAEGGVTGRFDSVSSNYAYLTPTLSYGAKEVGLQLDRNDQAFGDVALTLNASAAATAVEQLGYGNPVYDAVLFATEEQALAGFDMLSGEVHASIQSALIEDSRHVRNAMGERLTRSVGDPGLAVWTNAFGSWGKQDSSAGVASMDRDTLGILAGIDTAVGTQGRLGILGGHSTADLKSARGSADVKSYHLGVYGGFRFGALGLQVGVARSWHDINTGRAVAFNGFSDDPQASYDAATTQVYGEASYAIPVGAGSVEPFGNLAYVKLSTEEFDENGGPAALSAARAKSDVTFSTLGLRVATAKLQGQRGIALRGSAGWRHALNDRLPTAELAFAGSSPFTVVGTPLSKDAAVLDAGVDAALSSRLVISLGYSGQIGGNGSDHGVRAGVNFGF